MASSTSKGIIDLSTPPPPPAQLVHTSVSASLTLAFYSTNPFDVEDPWTGSLRTRVRSTSSSTTSVFPARVSLQHLGQRLTQASTSRIIQVGAKYCLSGGQDRSIRLWNPSTGKEIKSYKSHGYEVLGLSVWVLLHFSSICTSR